MRWHRSSAAPRGPDPAAVLACPGRRDPRGFIYARTPQQNARTSWGRYFPGFTEHQQRPHSGAAYEDVVVPGSGSHSHRAGGGSATGMPMLDGQGADA